MQPTRKSRWRWWLGTAGVVILSCLGICALIAFLGTNRLNRIRAKLDQQDPGWRWEQLVDQRPPLPDEENSALQVVKVHNLIRKAGVGFGVLDSYPERPSNEALLPWQAQALQTDLAPLATARTEAGKLAAMTRGRLPLPKANALKAAFALPELESHQTVARLLRHEVVLLLHEGKRAEACERNRAMFNIGLGLREEPLLITHIIRSSLDRKAVECLERILGQSEPTEVELAALQTVLAERLPEQGFRVAIRGERAMVDALLTNGEFQNLLNSLPAKPTTLGWHDSHAGKLLEQYSEIVDLADVPPQMRHQQIKAVYDRLRDEASSTHKRWLNAYVLTIMPSCLKVSHAHQRTQAYVTCAHAGIAAERYRLQHGHWPARIEDLEPLIGALPIDPYDGLPLRLKVLPDGVLLYSVNWDGADDGGVLNDDSRPMQRSDLGFRLWDPKRRCIESTAD